MPGIVALIFITGITAATYLFLVHVKKIDWKALKISAAVGIILAVLVVWVVTKTEGNGGWCGYYRHSTNYPPAKTITAMDYFEEGNFYYDTGRCQKAIESYTKSIEINPNYPEAYNNRAYTLMQMRNYNDALPDLDRAIQLKPDYINALMNRGDIYRDRIKDKEKAIADYQKIISLAGTKGTSVCGHLAMAENYTKNPLSFFKAIWATINCRGGSN